MRKGLKKGSFVFNIVKYRQLYVLLIPAIIFFIIYRYIPMVGVVLAFKDYQPWLGIAESPWIGFENFENLFNSGNFIRLLKNTLIISGLKIVLGFPVPIILALMLNEAKGRVFKRSVQTVTYLPHFLSWVIIYGIFYNILNVTYGSVNDIIKKLGGEPIAFLSEPKYFRGLLVATSIWKSAGFGTIIYLAALSGIDPMLYDSAKVDGANRWQMIVHITVPCLLPTAAILLILTLGSILSEDMQQILIFMGSNPLLLNLGDVFETHAYRIGMLQAKFSYGTAVGLFQATFGMVLVIAANQFARKKLGYLGIF